MPPDAVAAATTTTTTTTTTASPKLRALAERWAVARPAERANAQSYLIELCESLGVERPRPAGGGSGNGNGNATAFYEFEHPVKVVARDGTESVNFVDLYKAEHFLLEAKDAAAGENGESNERLMHRAFGQARTYAGNLPGTQPPYLLVLDIGRTLIVWDRWNGAYGGFSAGLVIDLRTLAARPAEIELLQDLWENPSRRDPRARAAAVTEEIAATLAELAAALEGRGHGQEAVARYLMRCVFTMFAEDVGLLADAPFRSAVDAVGTELTPEKFSSALASLWKAMDEGDRWGLHHLLRFNGHFFKDQSTIPLTTADIAILRRAAAADWQHVEPTIFGTLLTRALDPDERHRLGAEYTPRAFIERLVRPTVEEPIRERWTLVQAEVLQLGESKKKKERDLAVTRIDEFHGWLRGLRFLDPACGSGNFLYVTLHLVKSIELEVIRARETLTGAAVLRMEEVNPSQFFGIEVKPWAREIAELTLWIGFHQFWRQHHDVQPPEPVLVDTGTLEQRDAVLAWDSIRHDPSRDRPDPTPRIRHPVTGELVPDPKAVLKYMEYVNPRQAAWPQADFIVGNPPYLGAKRMRDALGDGYVDAIRSVYPDLPDSADFVLYWWAKSATEVALGSTSRAGLITTNSIRMSQNRVVVEQAIARGAVVIWAVSDHPWTDGVGDAAVRVSMTVVSKDSGSALLVRVDNDANVVNEKRASRLNSDLSISADIASASRTRLSSHDGLSSFGFLLNGAGFIVSRAEAETLIRADSRNSEIIRPYRNGKDVAARPRDVFVIDFAERSEAEARVFAQLFDIVRDRVMPTRVAKNDSARKHWWRFGRTRPDLRTSLSGLSRFIITGETSKHRTFTFFDAAIAPDHMLVCIASDEAWHLGVLSSQIHVFWALAAGGRLGVGNDPRYNKSLCFDPFPFPTPNDTLRARIADVAERLDAHRKAAIARDERVTMTGMYNVVEKLRTDAALTPKEREIHTLAACGVLRDLHDELDQLVADAYGWPWPMPREEILERLVALHDVRVDEEKRGLVRWLRPDYQIPRFAADRSAAVAPGELALADAAVTPAAVAAKPAWPATVLAQIAALKALADAAPLGADEAASRFTGARRELVVRHLETLAIMGELQLLPDGRYAATAVAA